MPSRRARDEQRGDRSGPAAFPSEHAASDDDASHPEPASVAEVFAEECHAEERRRRHLDVEQEGHRAGGREAEPAEEEDRPDDAAGDEGQCEPHPVGAVQSWCRRTVEHGNGGDAGSRPEVEQPGELKRG